MIKVGCCGFPCSREVYFKRFEVVEIQKTFYSLPSIDKVRRWRTEKPEGFEYTLKAWQLITHTPDSPTYRKAGLRVDKSDYGFFKPSRGVFEAWERFSEIARELDAKVIVFQCPPSFHENTENIRNLKSFFSSIGKGFVYVIEFRGRWSSDKVIEVCKEFNLIHCVDPFKSESYHGDIGYYRLHGVTGYRYDYSRDELKKLLGFCSGKDCYCLFNNTEMFKNAVEFKEMIS